MESQVLTSAFERIDKTLLRLLRQRRWSLLVPPVLLDLLPVELLPTPIIDMDWI